MSTPNVTIIDNGGRTFDRYRVQFHDDGMDDGELLIGPTGNVPNGVCMWAEGQYPCAADETEVLYANVPEPVQRAIINEIALQAELLAQYGSSTDDPMEVRTDG